ncbi:DNA repair protein rhp9 [Leucoagaricus sp. SymC.cos]|nr:DNA repair protein rhp9 [Leucoagaricus sp. SymC.cos]
MSPFDGSLSEMETEESQATQLIHAALEKSPEPSGHRSRSGVSTYNKDISVDSFPSSKNSSNSVRQYHFHGLAATQTDTQVNDDEEGSGLGGGEGSQKENFRVTGVKTGKDIKWGMPSPDSRSSSPHGLAVKDSVKTIGRSGSGTLGRGTKSKAPTVTFQSPVKNPIPSKPSFKIHSTKGKSVPPQPSRQRNSRSHSPVLSDDSFAQGDSQLAEERLLMTSKKFTTPLADLGGADEDDSSGDLSRRTEISYTNISSRTVARGQHDPPPVILVPSTPSQSESSDHSKDEISRDSAPSLPQEDDSPEQGQGSGRMILDSESSKGGSQPSQGFDGQDEVAEVQDLYSSKHVAKKPAPPPTQDSLFPETQQTTQLATQLEPNYVPATPSVLPQTNTTTYTNIGPRSLLSHMDPSKRGRYQHLVQMSPISPISSIPQQFPAGTSRMTTVDAETQLSDIPFRPVPPAPPIPAQAPFLRKPSPKKPILHEPTAPSSNDAMDVVPDSEPMREQIQTSVFEERSLEVDDTGPRKGRIVKRLSNESEATEDSDVASPKRVVRREEEEEEEEEEQGTESKAKDEEAEGPEDVQVEDSGDSDDDVPLSARFRKDKGKASATAPRGKAQHTYTSQSKVEKKARKTQLVPAFKGPARQQKGRQATKVVKAGPADTSNESAVPSSVPDQDHPHLVRNRKPSLKGAAAAKEKAKQAQRKASRATSVATSERSGRSAIVDAENDGDVEMEAASDSERATEIAVDEVEEEEEEEEEEEYQEPAAPQLKRKRGRPPKSKSLNQAAVTPRTRMTKRLKSAGSTMSRMDATRVFALWKQNSLWYPGTIHEYISGNSYMIRFDDGCEAAVITDNMRANNIRIGDFVRVGKTSKKAKEYKVVKVNYRSNAVVIDVGGETEELEFKEISISTKTINSSWGDRLIDVRTIVPAIRNIDTKVKPTPSPSRSATSFMSLNTNAKGQRQTKILQRVGLIVSLSSSNTNDKTKDGKYRADILSAVRDSGGVVIDDLFKYLKMDIAYLPKNWVLERDGVRWVGEPRVLERLFLLADDCNLKPKYLMALALGIPCLKTDWLFSCIAAGRELDWRPYLLPQGRPTAIDVLPSQQIDLSWGESLEHLSKITENPLASRLLADQSVLFLEPEIAPKGKTSDRSGEIPSYITRIILAMGASRVEAVRAADDAAKPLSQYDLLILRDKDSYVREFVQVHTVDWNWIKDSLIMSRQLPYPDWSTAEDSQCSQSL